MMKTFITILLTLLSLQLFAVPSPEDMYGDYDKDGKYRAMQEQMDQMIQKREEAEKEKSEKKMIALWGAVLVGLIPLGYIGKQIIDEKTWETNRKGTLQALAIGLVGGAVLFGLNYGIFLLKIEYGSKFNTVLVFLLVLSLVIGSIYAINKKSK